MPLIECELETLRALVRHKDDHIDYLLGQHRQLTSLLDQARAREEKHRALIAELVEKLRTADRVIANLQARPPA